MKDIKQFIEQFILDEYNCLRADYDFSIPDAAYEQLRLKASANFIEANKQDYWRGLEEDDVADLDEDTKKMYAQNTDKTVPRILFQIKQYEKPKLGEGLPRWLTVDKLYACYTSYTEKSDEPIDYSTLFYVSETNEGLKIIYFIRYDSDEQEWRHSHGLKINQVKNAGKLIAVEKYQAPEEATSLADYNKE